MALSERENPGFTTGCREPVEHWLQLRSRLSDIAYVHRWIERLASANSIHPDVQFAMELCLEEALSNVIRHGYGADASGTVMVRFAKPDEDNFAFEVEDGARPFDPTCAPEISALGPGREMRVGGQGLRLLRRFASRLEYHATQGGNRLRICFSVAGSPGEEPAKT